SSISITPTTSNSSIFPYTTLFRSRTMAHESSLNFRYPQRMGQRTRQEFMPINPHDRDRELSFSEITKEIGTNSATGDNPRHPLADRKSTRLNSSHVATSYAVFCLK